jgi:DNA-binding CsgD family transcriptional regulator/tetratricopeptide (TPR) repeat protein
MHIAQLSRIPATESLAPALADYLAGNYRRCLESAQDLLSEGAPQRAEALLLSARALLRLRRPKEAIKLLTAELPTFDLPDVKLEAESVLGTAHATVGDFATAGLHVESMREASAELPPALRAELLHAEAIIAWMRGDMTAATAALDASAFDQSPNSRGRAAITRSWIAARQARYEEQASLLLHGVELLRSASPLDVGLLASATRALCVLARDIAIPGLVVTALHVYNDLPWTSDLATDQFSSARTLGWALALQGANRYFEALRLLHKASSLSPAPAWHVFALLDRAALKRYAGESGSSSADLYEALELAKTIDWSSAPDESRLALVVMAELFVPIDVREAAAMLAQYSQVQESVDANLLMRGDPRVEAFRSYVSGVIQEALNEPRKAKRLYESAFQTWSEDGYAWQAARAALHLFKVTGEAQWWDTARLKIRDYPDSWIAAEINAASTGVGDDAWNRMTPRQREVFHSLCEGLTARKIAERLECSPNTIRNHIHWVYQAFRVNSQPELIAEARKRKLL